MTEQERLIQHTISQIQFSFSQVISYKYEDDNIVSKRTLKQDLWNAIKTLTGQVERLD